MNSSNHASSKSGYPRKIAFSVAIMTALVMTGCGDSDERIGLGIDSAAASFPDRGQLLIKEFGCGSCHVIPGIAAARGTMGPSLKNMARRAYVAGVLPNTYENMVNWLLDPQSISPDTAMPDVGLSQAQAEAITDYLYTLH